MEVNGYPIVHLASGQELRLLQIMLFQAPILEKAVQLRAKAMKILGGSGFSFGAVGAPNLTFAAEMAAVGLISGLLASAAQKSALEDLNAAQELLRNAKSSGKLFDVGKIQDLATPDPAAWYAIGEEMEEKRVEMSHLSRKEREAFCQKHGTKYDFYSTSVLIRVPLKFMHHADDFIFGVTDAGPIHFRWSQVAAYVPARD